MTQRAIGPRVSLAVVRVMGRTLLVGISPQGVQAVSELDDSAAVGPSDLGPALRSARSARPAVAPRPSFWQAFRLNLKRTLVPNANPVPAPAEASTVPLPNPPEPRLATRTPAPPAATEHSAVPAPPATEPFEEELASRLRELRDRYPTLWEVESTGIGGVH